MSIIMINGQTKKWHIHSMEYYSAIEMNLKQLYVIIKRILENIVLSKISQWQISHIMWFNLYKIFRIGKSIENERKFVASGNEEIKAGGLNADWVQVFYKYLSYCPR